MIDSRRFLLLSGGISNRLAGRVSELGGHALTVSRVQPIRLTIEHLVAELQAPSVRSLTSYRRPGQPRHTDHVSAQRSVVPSGLRGHGGPSDHRPAAADHRAPRHRKLVARRLLARRYEARRAFLPVAAAELEVLPRDDCQHSRQMLAELSREVAEERRC